MATSRVTGRRGSTLCTVGRAATVIFTVYVGAENEIPAVETTPWDAGLPAAASTASLPSHILLRNEIV
jgi:hypothetical protein